MQKIALVVTAAVALAVAGVVAAFAVAGSATSVYTYRSAMAPGAEVPKPKAAPGARGLFTATVTESGGVRTIRWKLTFSRLSGKAVAAHLHRGKAGVAGGVLLPLCGPCTTGQTGTATIPSDAADTLERGLAYVNVHTARNAAGEIRGQVRLVRPVVSSPPTEPGPVTTTPGYGSGGSDRGVGY